MAAGGNGFQNALGQQQSRPGVCITPAHHAVVGRILLPVRCAVVYGRAACGAQSPGLPPQGLCVPWRQHGVRPMRQAVQRGGETGGFPLVFTSRGAEYAPQKAQHLTAPRAVQIDAAQPVADILDTARQSGALYMLRHGVCAGEPGGPGIFLHQVPSGGFRRGGRVAAPEFPLVQQFVIILRLHLRALRPVRVQQPFQFLSHSENAPLPA